MKSALAPLSVLLLVFGCSAGKLDDETTPTTHADGDVPKDDSGDVPPEDSGPDPIVDTGPPPSGSGCSSKSGYPAAPYGIVVGSVIDPRFQWEGWADSAAASAGTATKYCVGDLFDPKGTAILLTAAALWCPSCQGQAKTYFPSVWPAWQSSRVQLFELIVDASARGTPATPANAATWSKTFSASWPVVADPAASLFAPPKRSPLPHNVLIDPRTMKITFMFDGYGGTLTNAVNALIAKNK